MFRFKIDPLQNFHLDECKNHNKLSFYRSVQDIGFDRPDGKHMPLCDKEKSHEQSPDWVGEGWYRFTGNSSGNILEIGREPFIPLLHLFSILFMN